MPIFKNNPKDTLAKLNIVLPDGTFGAGFKVPPKAVFRDMVGDLKIGPAGGSQQVVEVAFLAFFAFFEIAEAAVSSVLVRRVRPCMLSLQDEQTLDLFELLNGRASISSEPTFIASSYIRGQESSTHARSSPNAAASATEWRSEDQVCLDLDLNSSVLSELIEAGLVLAAENEAESEQIWKPIAQLKTWNNYAILYHFMNRWEDMHLEIQLPQDHERLTEIMAVPPHVFEAFIRENGDPPPAFKNLEKPISALDLPVPADPEGELFETLARRKTTRAYDPDTPVTLDDFPPDLPVIRLPWLLTCLQAHYWTQEKQVLPVGAFTLSSIRW